MKLFENSKLNNSKRPLYQDLSVLPFNQYSIRPFRWYRCRASPFNPAPPCLQVVSAIPTHLDGKAAPGQAPTGSVCYERNGVRA